MDEQKGEMAVNPMKQWLKDQNISYRALATVMGLSASSVSLKVNKKVTWNSRDIAILHNRYGLSSDFVFGFSDNPYAAEVLV
ncbi:MULTISPECIES: XRE family transcriptional regulator [Bifidobacterium]|uniref:XRE family transcriptional regulator n=1 Tax=Bifidobacterium TaxID=1678 RepID=UPI001269D9E9|nr:MULTISPECIES: XRE family transcriptional regulator [Bifidobacterium]MCI1713395.1 XRE family transcriptional regulator [Bifidobacterium tibiigranuli]QOL36515.1 XRE family transcriptional regulator [Bifidobacterium subtile]